MWLVPAWGVDRRLNELARVCFLQISSWRVQTMRVLSRRPKVSAAMTPERCIQT